MSEANRLVNGRYRLRTPLGRGGSGVVWAAEDELLGRAVAVKEFLLPTGVGVEDRATMLERVLREARAAARLHDPSLVTVFDVVREDEQPWIVMEYVHGRSLAEVVREDGPMSPTRTGEVGVALLHALRTAHAGGVLHRDVKPANVLLDDTGHVRLTDFGIASTAGDPSLTSTGVLLGSPAYMAPERARGGKATPSSDLWSLGATLYTLVEGEPPYAGENSLAVLSAVADNNRRPMQRAGALAPILADLLDRRAAERPGVAELERRLRAAIASSAPAPVVPAATTRPERVGERTTVLAPLPPAASVVERRAAEQPVAERPVAQQPVAGGAAALAAGGAAVAAGSALAAAAAPPVAPLEPVQTPVTAPVTAPVPPRRVEPRRVPPRPVAPVRGPVSVPAGRTVGAVQVTEHDRHRRRKAGAVLGGVAALAALLVAAVALMSGSTHKLPGAKSFAPVSQSPVAGAGAAASATPSPGRSTPSPSPSVSASPSPPASVSPSASAAVVPAGSQTYRNPRYGWSVAQPAGWSAGQGITADQVDLRDPTTGRLLRIEIGAQAHPSAIADWYSYEPTFARQVSGYQRIRISPSDGGTGKQSADWEFTFRSGSVTLHVLDRGVVDGKTAHALYWQTTDADWAASQPQFQQLAASFVPPPQA